MNSFARAVARRLLRRVRRASRRLQRIDIRGWKTAPEFKPQQLRPLSHKHPRLDSPNIVELASSNVEKDELALCISVAEEARAYPLSVVNGHDVVNDQLGDQPLAVTFCDRCFSAAAFDPVIDGIPLTFEATGVYAGAFVMSDDQTGTIWSPVSGEALAGPLVGRQLGWLVTQVLPVATWLHFHPDSSAIDPIHRVSTRPPSPGSARVGREWLRTVGQLDRRVPPRSLVVGVLLDGIATAFVLNGSGGQVCHQDVVGEVPVVLLGAPGAIPTVYDRRTQRGVVELRLDAGTIVDSTGSIWTADAEATEGKLAGTRLQPVRSRMSEWYAWAAAYPNTDVLSIPVGYRPG